MDEAPSFKKDLVPPRGFEPLSRSGEYKDTGRNPTSDGALGIETPISSPSVSIPSLEHGATQQGRADSVSVPRPAGDHGSVRDNAPAATPPVTKHTVTRAGSVSVRFSRPATGTGGRTPARPSPVRSCACGHVAQIHGPMGCEGLYSEFDGISAGPCDCREFS